MSEPKELGRGLALHKSIQKRLRDEAQKFGFKADIEKQLVKGSNSAADLVLRQGGLAIAVEIAISPTINHEFENVQKCLAAGFGRVAVIATGRKRLDDIAAAVQSGLGSEAAAKVIFHTPDEFLVELKKLAKSAEATTPSNPVAETETVLGFKVTRKFPKLPPEEQRLIDQAVHQGIEPDGRALQPRGAHVRPVDAAQDALRLRVRLRLNHLSGGFLPGGKTGGERTPYGGLRLTGHSDRTLHHRQAHAHQRGAARLFLYVR